MKWSVGQAVCSRRAFLLGGAALATTAPARAVAHKKTRCLILAPSNLGLRPEADGTEPGTWRAPQALMAAGLEKRVAAREVMQLPRPPYETGAQTGTRIRNGQTLRSFSLQLGAVVRKVMEQSGFPIVIGGDCSVLLGSLYGARSAGARGLVHVDGHSDFSHPGNYDTQSRLGSAAGMDLALVTGRGEPLLAQWPGVDGPLVRDEDAIQLGERNAFTEAFRAAYGDIERTAITRYIIQDVLKAGIERTAQSVISHLEGRGLHDAWLHVDLDVLDESIMPAVDSPGSPGLTFAQLRSLIAQLYRSEHLAGATIAIYDPARDPESRYAGPIAATLGSAFTSNASDAT